MPKRASKASENIKAGRAISAAYERFLRTGKCTDAGAWDAFVLEDWLGAEAIERFRNLIWAALQDGRLTVSRDKEHLPGARRALLEALGHPDF